MSRTHRRAARRSAALTCGLLLAGLLLTACSDDEKNDVTGPGDDDGGAAAELLDADVYCSLSEALTEAGRLLFAGGGTVAGQGGGQIVVQGTTITFEDYSPDGTLFLDGSVVLDFTVSPPTVSGAFTRRSGDEEGEILVAITIEGDLAAPTFGGTLTFDGEAVDLSTVETPDCSR